MSLTFADIGTFKIVGVNLIIFLPLIVGTIIGFRKWRVLGAIIGAVVGGIIGQVLGAFLIAGWT